MKPRPAGAIFPRLHSALAYLTFLALMFLLAAGTNSQQEADSTFDVRVAHPSYTTTHPKVLFDEAHNNFHTSSGRYKPFADLISNDGYQVLPNKRKFEKQTLEGFDVLVIANALGSPDVDAREASNPAFTESECDAVRDWVGEGGNLLLIADHAPAGGAAANLATRFGVEMSKAYVADPTNFQRIALDASWIVFSRENRALADNAITRGRNNSEQINRVMSFTGQSLKGPPESVPILKLSDAAYDVFELKDPEKAKTTSAAGRAQAVALEFGKGRGGDAYGPGEELWYELSGHR